MSVPTIHEPPPCLATQQPQQPQAITRQHAQPDSASLLDIKHDMPDHRNSCISHSEDELDIDDYDDTASLMESTQLRNRYFSSPSILDIDSEMIKQHDDVISHYNEKPGHVCHDEFMLDDNEGTDLEDEDGDEDDKYHLRRVLSKLISIHSGVSTKFELMDHDVNVLKSQNKLDFDYLDSLIIKNNDLSTRINFINSQVYKPTKLPTSSKSTPVKNQSRVVSSTIVQSTMNENDLQIYHRLTISPPPTPKVRRIPGKKYDHGPIKFKSEPIMSKTVNSNAFSTSNNTYPESRGNDVKQSSSEAITTTTTIHDATTSTDITSAPTTKSNEIQFKYIIFISILLCILIIYGF